MVKGVTIKVEEAQKQTDEQHGKLVDTAFADQTEAFDWAYYRSIRHKLYHDIDLDVLTRYVTICTLVERESHKSQTVSLREKYKNALKLKYFMLIT